MNKRTISILLVLTLAFLVGLPGALAFPSFLDAFNTTYPSAVGSRIDTCELCHINPAGGGARNPYGLDFQSNGENAAALTTIEPLDSDGDGFINIDEIHNLTFPGNASDHPNVTITPTPTPTPNVTETPNVTATPTVTTTPTVTPISNATFVANMTGSEEVPPVDTLAQGNATFNLSDNGTVLQFQVSVANITNATVSHIHLAPVGVNGSIVVFLYPGPTKVGRFDGMLAEGNITQENLTGPLAGQPLSALIDNMTDGNTYVNVHTTQNPDGEIRGQIQMMSAPIAPNATFNISGFKINNATGSGVPDWNITLTNSMMQTMSTLTDMNGSYMFTNLTNDTYNVTEGLQTGWMNVSPMSQQVTINGTDMMNVNFTNQPPSNVTAPTFNISGFKINDTNGNGVWDSGEMGIENWNIMLLNNTGVQLANTSTNASGFYQFMNIFPGTYNVTEEMKAGFNSTNATSMPVTVENMDVMNVNFTNQPVAPTATPTITATVTPTATETPNVTATPTPTITPNITATPTAQNLLIQNAQQEIQNAGQLIQIAGQLIQIALQQIQIAQQQIQIAQQIQNASSGT